MKPKLYLINGPLGAGKTTFLKELLKSLEFSGARVIENEFASTSIDTDQLHNHQAEVQTIAGVCICCSTGDELTDALATLSSESSPVIIEATGVANSLKLIEKIVTADMLDKYDIAHAFFVLDAAEAVHDYQSLDLYTDELQAADVVLLSKSDLVPAEALEALLDSLSKLSIRQLAFSREGVVETAMQDGASNILEYFSKLSTAPVNRDGGSNYTVVDTEGLRFDVEALRASWDTLRDTYGLRRLKGDVDSTDGRRWHVEATPAQCRIEPSDSSNTTLVFIGANAREITRATIATMAVQ